jgi:hypothetical protein
MRRPSMLAAILVSLVVLTAASPASAMYHPTVGRWAARDPIGYSDGMSLYESVRSRPISLVDPAGQEAATASPKTDYGYGGACCCTGPEDCYIDVKWESSQQVYTPPGTNRPILLEGGKGVRVSTSVPGEKGAFSWTIQAFVTVEVKHRKNLPVGGCHLIQNATRWDAGAPKKSETLEDYGPTMPDRKTGKPSVDSDPSKPGFQNEVGRTIYKGYRLDDAPVKAGPASSASQLGGFFQADVYVKEATSVKKSYGYWVLLRMQGGSPVVGGLTWDDEPRDPFDPSVKQMNDNRKDQWYGPAPLDLRPNQPPPKDAGYYAVQ